MLSGTAANAKLASAGPGFVSAPWHLGALLKEGHTASAEARAIHGIGLEIRFYWDGDFRASQLHRDP